MLAYYYLILGIFLIFFEVLRPKKVKVDFLSVFGLVFFLGYISAGFLLNLDFQEFATGNAKWVDPKTIGSLSAALAIPLGYLFVALGFYSFRPGSWSKIAFQTSREVSFYTWSIFIGIVLSLLLISVYSSQYGGYISALAKSSLIRSGLIESGPFSFFKRFFPLSQFCSFLVFFLLFVKKVQQHRTTLYLMFFFSILITFYTLLLQSGRLSIIEYFLIFPLIMVASDNRKIFKNLLTFSPVFLLIIIFGDAVFNSLKELEKDFFEVDSLVAFELDPYDENNWVAVIFGNFQHYYVSLEVALNVVSKGQHELRWFVDWIYGFQTLLPDVILGTKAPDTIGSFNTQYIKGYFIMQIPPGLFAYGIYSMGWTGLIFWTYLFGYIGGYFHNLALYNLKTYYWGPIVYVSLIIILGYKLVGGEPAMFFQAIFTQAFLCLLLIFSGGKNSIQMLKH